MRIKGTSHEDQYTYIYDHISLNSSQNEKCFRQNCGENQNTHFMVRNFFFPQKCYIYGVMWKSIVQPGRPQIIIWRMRIACWIPKATNTHSEYVILIAFPLQQWLHERASVLRHTYIACIVNFSIINWSVFLVERDFILSEERNECLSAS